MKMELSKVLFWDVDYDTIDWEKHARYVIERVATLGRKSDWLQIKSYYGLERIKLETLESRDLDDKTMSFLACVFNISQTEFRCYKLKQSYPAHLNF